MDKTTSSWSPLRVLHNVYKKKKKKIYKNRIECIGNNLQLSNAVSLSRTHFIVPILPL